MRNGPLDTKRYRAAILALEKTLEREGINRRTPDVATRKKERAEYLALAKRIAGVKPKKDNNDS